jgi:hypothetical protein
MAATDAHRVFVYGSLLHEPSLMATLAHRADAPPAAPFDLIGWERAWCVVSARTFARADDPTGIVHRRLVLGIRPAPGATCTGVVLELGAADLQALATREAAYELTDLGPVSAFVPRPDRVLGTSCPAEPLVVEQAYLDECRAGIAAHGLAGASVELDRSLAGLAIASATDVPGTA